MNNNRITFFMPESRNLNLNYVYNYITLYLQWHKCNKNLYEWIAPNNLNRVYNSCYAIGSVILTLNFDIRFIYWIVEECLQSMCSHVDFYRQVLIKSLYKNLFVFSVVLHQSFIRLYGDSNQVNNIIFLDITFTIIYFIEYAIT